MDIAGFLDGIHEDLGPVQRALALDAMADARADAASRREDEARQALREERAELTALAFRRGGVPAGELQRFRVLAEQADDQLRDLTAQLERATSQRARAHEGITALTAQLDEINRAVASRAATPDLLAPAKAAMAEHADYVALSRQMLRAARAGNAPRPFADGPGTAVRGEPVICAACLSVGASPEESWWIHHSDADGNPLAAAPDVPVSVPPGDSERAEAGYGQQITRVTQTAMAVR